MGIYARLLRYVLPYWRRVLLLFAVIMVFASLSGVSLTLIPPFLKILLQVEEPAAVEAPPEAETTASAKAVYHGLPLPRRLEEWKDTLTYRFESHMYAGSAATRLYRFCRILLLLVLIKNIFGYVQTYLTEYLEQKVLFRIRNDVYAHIHDLPMSFFDREKTGHVISRLTNDVTLLRGAVVGVAASVVRNTLMALIAVLIILLVSWRLALLTLVVIPVNVALVGMIGRKLRKRSLRAQEGMADMTATLQEAIAGIRVVKAFNQGEFERRRFERFSLKHLRQYIKMQLWGALSAPTSEMLGALSVVVILWYGGSLVLTKQITPESLILFVGAMLWVVAPVRNLSKLNNVVQQSRSAAERVFMILDIPQEPLGKPGKRPEFQREIRFESIDFEYVPGKLVLRNITFTVRPGEVVAIVGPSGAGKTTLVDMIPRFYEPVRGRITMDGVDIREMNLKSLRSLMGIVTQDTILFNDTVRNNIAYGLEDRPLNDVVAAAKTANTHEFIADMPHGYDTLIGDRGTLMSGGQRQRIAIARALLRDPEILIFDEATSSLDTESEMLVQEAIDCLLKGRTTFVIAHRLSTIQHADQILVVEDGWLKEQGSHSELIRRNGIYRRLYDLQFGLASSEPARSVNPS